MHEEVHKRTRCVIPRWRPVARAVALGEATAVSGGPPTKTILAADANSALDDALETFDKHPKIAFAAEAVAAAILAGRPEAAEAPARHVLDAPALSSGLVSLANACIAPSARRPHKGPDSLTEDYIRSFRAQLRVSYVSPFTWLDLALAHTSVGNYDKAKRALLVARGLMRRPSRLLLRAEARFHQHAGDPGQALHKLRQVPDLVLADPWLLAAEIGLHRHAGSTSMHVKRARRMISEDIAPFHLSELAAAVGTEELMAGSHKRARRLFQAAVVDPAEQGLAQTVWARQRDNRIVLPAARTLRRSAEAWAREAAVRLRWPRVVRACWKWLAEEPFASTPAMMLSSILPVYIGDFHAALEAVNCGLAANPENPMLINNKAFVLARLDRPREAADILSDIDTKVLSDPQTAILVTATAGLLFMRCGLIEECRRLYQRAYELARVLDRRKGSHLASRVALFFVAEARVFGILDDKIDAPMIKLADPDKLKDELADLHKALKRHVRPPRPGREAAVYSPVQDLLHRLT